MNCNTSSTKQTTSATMSMPRRRSSTRTSITRLTGTHSPARRGPSTISRRMTSAISASPSASSWLCRTLESFGRVARSCRAATRFCPTRPTRRAFTTRRSRKREFSSEAAASRLPSPHSMPSSQHRRPGAATNPFVTPGSSPVASTRRQPTPRTSSRSFQKRSVTVASFRSDRKSTTRRTILPGCLAPVMTETSMRRTDIRCSPERARSSLRLPDQFRLSSAACQE